jgi:hypothetical protein
MRRHIDGWRPSSGVLVGVLALVAAVAGPAVAGPTATTSKLSKKKVVKIADQEINKLAPGLSVAHAESANTATNADRALSANTADSATTAQSATNADTARSVGGVSIEPVSIALIDGPSFAEALNVNGSFVLVTCLGSSVSLEVDRGASSPPISAQWIRNGIDPLVTHPPPGAANSTSGGVLGLTATVREGSGRVTRMTVDAFYETNAFGGAEDCFVQGTIERFG